MIENSARPHILGLGGTLHGGSLSRWALERALAAAEAAGATTELLTLEELELPFFEPGRPLEDFGPAAAQLIAAASRAHGMLWSTGAYHGTLAGVTKNALDFLEFLDVETPPYLHGKVVGLIATSGGEIAGVNALNAMVHTAHALRGTVAPLMVAIPQARRAFAPGGEVREERWAKKLDQLGCLVVEMAAARANAERLLPTA